MIISASRRTDIPAYYSHWFFNRLKKGFSTTKNPFNPKQTKNISLKPNDVDCFVFWSKNPAPMLERFDELNDYHFYFQFTLNAYSKLLEPFVPSEDTIIDTFKRLAEGTGIGRIIRRYDPIIISDNFDVDYHINKFGETSKALKGYFNKAVISFLDSYEKINKPMEALGCRPPNEAEITDIAKGFGDIAKENDFEIETCAEIYDLSAYGINQGSCISGKLIEEITGKIINCKKDSNQRTACGCVQSVDIGAYDTCISGCVYCYANKSRKNALNRYERHNAQSAMIVE